jgi:acyl carrier protein
MDQQIKIRGVRVELGEIEVILREHPDIRDAVVMVQDEGEDKRLVAYALSSSPQPPSIPALQEWLGTKLPKILIPSAILFLPEFPKTPNEKLDRSALARLGAEPSGEKPAAPPSVSFIPSSSIELEALIAGIWARTLRLRTVGLDERFFDIGGNSLLMIEVHGQLHAKMGHEVPLLDLFQYPTVRSLAKHLRKRTTSGSTKTSTLIRGKLRLQLAARQNSLRKSGSKLKAGPPPKKP